MDVSNLVSREILTAAAVLGATAVAAYYYKSTRSVTFVPERRSGSVDVHPSTNSVKEYRRDCERFIASGSVHARGASGKITVVPSLESLEPLNYYGLSTSICMDVVQGSNITPPIIHQPVMLVGASSIEILGFVGTPVSGVRPDMRHTPTGLRIIWEFNSPQTCQFYIFPSKNATKSIDLLGLE